MFTYFIWPIFMIIVNIGTLYYASKLKKNTFWEPIPLMFIAIAALSIPWWIYWLIYNLKNW